MPLYQNSAHTVTQHSVVEPKFIMESPADFTMRLEAMTYRCLQQIAKKLCLPSNFKKVYLVELIVARKFNSEAEVNNIIQRVRQERLNLSKVKKTPKGRAKKIKFQGAAQKILAARNSVADSPPITVTPKRPSIYWHDSPEVLPITPLNPKRNLLDTINPQNRNSNTSFPGASASDRVLRSYTLKTDSSNYALTSDIQELKAQRCSNRNTKIRIIEQNKCYVRKRHDNDLLQQEFLISDGGEVIRATGPKKRQRSYLAPPEEPIPRINQSVSIRRNDGSYAKINAVVQKCNTIALKKNNYNTKSPEITFQDTLDEDIHEDFINENNNHYFIEYPNVTDINPTKSAGTIIIDNNYKENYSASDVQRVDYELKISEEQLIYQRDIPLPKICDVFPRFSYMRDATQPIYVQVGSESLYNVPCYPTHVDRSSINTALETLFNMQTNGPLQQNNADTTRCTYTTHTVPTVTALPDPTMPAGGALNVTSPALDNNVQYPDVDIHLQEFLQLIPDPEMTDFSGSSSSMDMMYSIPEMLEDALEIISQDTEYMESIGMSEPVQCVFCGWARPIILLEHHIRKEHAHSIQNVVKNEWNITYTLQSLVQCDVWLHRVIEYDWTLYLLSVKYEHPGCFMATMSLLSLDLLEPKEQFVTMTLFNKRTGEPLSWTGQVLTFPPSSPSDNTTYGLKLDLAELDLVLNNPAIYDIHVIMFVKIS